MLVAEEPDDTASRTLAGGGATGHSQCHYHGEQGSMKGRGPVVGHIGSHKRSPSMGIRSVTLR